MHKLPVFITRLAGSSVDRVIKSGSVLKKKKMSLIKVALKELK